VTYYGNHGPVYVSQKKLIRNFSVK